MKGKTCSSIEIVKRYSNKRENKINISIYRLVYLIRKYDE